MFLGWKTWVEPEPMEHNRTSTKSVPPFVALVPEPEFGQDLVRWGTCMRLVFAFSPDQAGWPVFLSPLFFVQQSDTLLVSKKEKRRRC